MIEGAENTNKPKQQSYISLNVEIARVCTVRSYTNDKEVIDPLWNGSTFCDFRLCRYDFGAKEQPMCESVSTDSE